VQRRYPLWCGIDGGIELGRPAKAKVVIQDSQAFELHLYVAGNAPNSVAAIANLAKICSEHAELRCSLKVIDLMKNPALAVAHQILATPTLVRKLPLPIRKIIGNLSNTEQVVAGLEIRKYKRSKKR